MNNLGQKPVVQVGGVKLNHKFVLNECMGKGNE